jgi:site-specific recombinase XerD
MLARYTISMMAAKKAEGTINLYVRHLSRYNDLHPLLDAGTHDLEVYLAHRAIEGLAAESLKSIRSAFVSFFTWAKKNGHVESNPAIELEPIPVHVKPPRVAPDIVVQMGLLTADQHLSAMIMLARYACLRLTEFTTLHSGQREYDLLRINGKGSKERMVPVNEPLMAALLTLEREQGSGFYFPGRAGPHLHPQAVTKMISRHLGTNPHSLRHAGATAAYEATHDLEAVRKLLGHASIATTQRYLHVGMDAVRRAAAATAILGGLTAFPPTTAPPTGRRRLAPSHAA